MNYGLYLAASGTLSNLYRMDVFANNLANSQTTGFKPVFATVRARDAASVEDGLSTLPSSRMLEQLGAGVMMLPNRVSLRQGTPETTGRKLDLAIQGDGFFVVQEGRGSDPASLRLTRDGRLALDGQGRLVQASSGKPVLDRSGRAITLAPDRDISIDAAGAVLQGGVRVGDIQFVSIPDTANLQPRGAGLFTAPPAVIAKRSPATGQLIQGAIEGSAVDPIRATMDIASAERAVGSSTRLIQLHDQLMDRAINTFGRIG